MSTKWCQQDTSHHPTVRDLDPREPPHFVGAHDDLCLLQLDHAHFSLEVKGLHFLS